MRSDRYKASDWLSVAKFSAILNAYFPFTDLQDFLILIFGLCVLGDTERRVAFYDTENDAYEEDGKSDYMWEGERLPIVLTVRIITLEF